MNKFRKAVFVVVYSLEGKKPEYLLLKRKLHWKGWEFPKGKIERFELKRKTARRETKEETGLDILKLQKHPYKGRYLYPKSFKDRLNLVGQTFQLFSGKVKKGKISLDPKEHSGHKWCSYSEALKKLTHDEKKKSLKIVNGWLTKK